MRAGMTRDARPATLERSQTGNLRGAIVATRNPTRAVRVGSVTIGGGSPIVVQSMAATRTQDIPATVRQVQLLEQAGAGPRADRGRLA